ncbi:NIPSNAP family protein [Gimibacter soli]|uniref:NIPSNAP family protein n=1 Tax=Gimibacter soli TaxID=3024400 RepID=A0AAE9XT76_9PROT|nr:NIPSNAP family protein [Gimibacter soli]WCL52818.1 NIPSNAP family protein [Gimibacter soli]
MRLALAAATSLVLLASPVATVAAAEPMFSGHIQQLRIYEIPEENRTAFNDRFRDHAARIMKRYGFNIRAMWESRSPDGKLQFVYLLDWQDEMTMKAAWTRFMDDTEWKAIKRETGARHGKFVNGITDMTLAPLPFSPALAE